MLTTLKKCLILMLFGALIVSASLVKAETPAEAAAADALPVPERREPPLRKVVELKMEEAIFMRMQKDQVQAGFADSSSAEEAADNDVLKRLETPDFDSKVNDIFDALY